MSSYLDDHDVCPSYFKDVRQLGDAWEKGIVHLFRINSGLPKNAKIPKE